MASFEHTPAVAAYLPSEVARLVLGYLKDENCMKTCEMFLTECRHLTEYSALLKQGLTYPLHVDGKSLVTILDEYRSMAMQELDPQRPSWLKQLWRKHDIMINQLKLVHGMPCSSTYTGKQHGAGFQRPLRRIAVNSSNAAIDRDVRLSSANSITDVTESRTLGVHPPSDTATMSVTQSPAYSSVCSRECTSATALGNSVPLESVSSFSVEMNGRPPVDVTNCPSATQPCFRNSPVPILIPTVTVASPAAIAIHRSTVQTPFPISMTTVDACSSAPTVTVSLAAAKPVYVTSALPVVVTTSASSTSSSFYTQSPLHSSLTSQREHGEASILNVDMEPHNATDQSSLREAVSLTDNRETPSCATITPISCPATASTDTDLVAQPAEVSVQPESVGGTIDVTLGSPRRKRSSSDRKKRMTPGKNVRSPGKDDPIENLSDLFPMPSLVETLLKATEWHEHLAENINRHLTRRSTDKNNDEAQNNSEETPKSAASAVGEPAVRFEESETEAAIREVLALTRDDPMFNDFHALIDTAVCSGLAQDSVNHTSATSQYDSTICYSDVDVVHYDGSEVRRVDNSSAGEHDGPSPDAALSEQCPIQHHFQSHQQSQWQHSRDQQQDGSVPSVGDLAHCASSPAASTPAVVAAGAVAPAAVPFIVRCGIPCDGDTAASTSPVACVASVLDTSTNAMPPVGLVIDPRRSPSASVNSPSGAVARCENSSSNSSTPPLTVYPVTMSTSAKFAHRATGSAASSSRCTNRVASPELLHSVENTKTVTAGPPAAAAAAQCVQNPVENSVMTATGGFFVNLAPQPAENGATMYVVISNGNKVEVVRRGRTRVSQPPARRSGRHIKPLHPANSVVPNPTVKPSSDANTTASPVELAAKPVQRDPNTSQKKRTTTQPNAASSDMAQRRLTRTQYAKNMPLRSGSHVRVLTFSSSLPETTVDALGGTSSCAVTAEPTRSIQGRRTTASRNKQPVLSDANGSSAASCAAAPATIATVAATAEPEDTVPELVGQVIHVVEQQGDHRSLAVGAASDYALLRCEGMDVEGGTNRTTSSDDDLFQQFTIVDNASEPGASGLSSAAVLASTSCNDGCVKFVTDNALPTASHRQPVAVATGRASTSKKRPTNKRALSVCSASDCKDAKKRKLKNCNINNLLSKIHQ